MNKVIGVKFKDSGKIYYFDPLELEIGKGGNVIVETARGLVFGEVAEPPEDNCGRKHRCSAETRCPRCNG